MVNVLKNSRLKCDENLRRVVSGIIGDRSTADIYRDQKIIAEQIGKKLKLTQEERDALVDVVRRLCKCYAGPLDTNRAGHSWWRKRRLGRTI